MTETGSTATSTLPTLRGTSVRLRHITAADGPALLEVFGNPRVARFIGIPLLRGDQDVQDLLESISMGIRCNDLLQWGVTLLESDRLIGTCTLAHIDWANERAEIGFALATSAWGKGVMRAALPLLIDHAFASLGLHRLEADVDPRNDRSLRLLDQLGFRREGLMRERHLVAGERQDTVFLGLLAADWQQARAGDCPPVEVELLK